LIEQVDQKLAAAENGREAMFLNLMFRHSKGSIFLSSVLSAG